MVLAIISVLVCLFGLSAFFSSAETVLFSLTPRQLQAIERVNPSVGKRLAAWQKEPARILSTILAGNTLVNFAIASLGYMLMLRFVTKGTAAVSVATFTLLLLVFGEILPKQYAMRHAEKMAAFCVRMLLFWRIVLKPFSVLMVAGSRVFGDLLTRERRALSDDELRAVVESAAASGELDREEASMVEGVMRLPDLYALNEMTPRVRLKGVEVTLPDAEKVRLAEETDYPFLPIYMNDMDHIEGFLDTERLLADPARNVSAAIDPPLRVSEHQGLDDMLVLFMKTGRRIALVEDRWGGTAGVITRGDILGLIVKPVIDDGEDGR